MRVFHLYLLIFMQVLLKCPVFFKIPANVIIIISSHSPSLQKGNLRKGHVKNLTCFPPMLSISNVSLKAEIHVNIPSGWRWDG